jgi:LysR family transcriptional regulator for bpeEF and oprC
MATIRDLEISVCLAATGSIPEAARETRVTLSVVRKRISTLEKRLGVRLFYRPSGRLELTADGRALYERATIILLDA